MSVAAVIGWIAAVASIVGLGVAFHMLARDRSRRKQFTFSTGRGLPLAQSQDLGDYKLQVTFESDRQSMPIKSATVNYVSFANLGREAIRREDIAPANPVRITINGARVLSADVERVTREVCRMEQEISRIDEESADVLLSFDFLDQGDGAVVSVLTEGRPEEIDVAGDIVGMPSGLVRLGASREKTRARTVLSWLANLIVFAIPLGSVAVLYSVSVGVEHLWWLALAIVGLLVSVAGAAWLSDTAAPARTAKLPFQIPGAHVYMGLEGEVRLVGPHGWRELPQPRDGDDGSPSKT